MGSIFRDTDLDRRFVDDGYVVVPFLPASEVTQVRRLFDRLHPQKLLPFYTSAMRHDAGYQKAVYDGIRAVFDPKIAAIFDGCKICIAGFNVKEAGEKLSEVALHADPCFVDESEFTSANIWCPLSEVTTANGCLQVVPGSQYHALPLRPFVPNGAISHPFHDVTPLLKAKYARSVEMAAGEAVIFNLRLLHGSGPNMSADRRISAGCIVAGQQAPLRYSVRVSPTEAETFAVDEAFFWANQLGARPSGAKSLGVVEYKVPQFSEADVLQSPHLRRATTTSHNWRRWIGSWTGWMGERW